MRSIGGALPLGSSPPPREAPRAGREIVLEACGVRVVIDPHKGARVTSLRAFGREVLSGPEVHPSNFGSTLWTSPQSDWGWPPPAAYDDLAYEVVDEPGGVLLVGPVSAPLGVRLVKRFTIDPSDGALVVDSRIANESPHARAMAPWLVSRVPARGLTFCPAAEPWEGALSVESHGGAVWYRHRPEELDDTGKKAFGSGSAGFVAHLDESNGRLLFVNRFQTQPLERYAPGHGEVEVYGNARYVEVEVQGPYETIEPGACSAPWIVRLYVHTVPDDVDVSLGSAALVTFAA